ncbi:uncharacterized protein LOC134221205 [Armigeres subalbatus]|uniref:uncharacterized protein LOC134221205 n=1 Tax=Armigeres subalbatus TaxID=124917 RepID=UPI002ED59DF9
MTKRLQQNNQAFPEFYMQWVLAIRDLRIMQDNRFARPLIDALNQRLVSLKDNMIFKASLYLDPRFTYMNSTFFTPDEKEEVQNYIMCVWKRIEKLRSKEDSATTVQTQSLNTSNDIDNYLTEMFGGSSSYMDISQDPSSKIRQQLKMLEVEPRKLHDYDTWSHWLLKKSTHPELTIVALAILATPSNQVSVERAFSALGLVLSDLRTGLADETLEDILLLKLNADLFKKIFPSLYDWGNLRSNAL